MHVVALGGRSTDSVAPLLADADQAQLEASLRDLANAVGDRRLWHVSSTAQGGGVAELLSTLLPYAIDAGVPVAWLVLDLDEPFFRVTKRLHNLLHGGEGDGEGLGPADRATYDRTLEPEGRALLQAMSPGDIAVLHDPQTAGLIPMLRDHGVVVLWRCHIGSDDPNDLVRSAWRFLLPDVQAAEVCIFSRLEHRWDGIDPDRVAIVPPSIDIVSSKNRALPRDHVTAILARAGLVARAEGTPGRTATMWEDEPIPAEARLVVQVSRWDWLKDPIGVMTAFVEHGPEDPDVHLCLAGPAVDGVTDDPEGAAVLAEVRAAWGALAPSARRRVHLAGLPMDDAEENALMVNALQRRADVVVQKSLAEGFGLTVAEAMWKSRPVVASRVGGIQDQIEHDVSGVLIDDPADLAACGRAITAVLDDRPRAAALGRAAHERVCERFLPTHHVAAEVAALELATASV